jgi:hypothetical protein
LLGFEPLLLIHPLNIDDDDDDDDDDDCNIFITAGNK